MNSRSNGSTAKRAATLAHVSPSSVTYSTHGEVTSPPPAGTSPFLRFLPPSLPPSPAAPEVRGVAVTAPTRTKPSRS
jgi:hypothetical protein